jgi:hypothetical protein
MGNHKPDQRTVLLLALSLALATVVAVWRFRRTSTDHDVSDPGITL